MIKTFKSFVLDDNGNEFKSIDYLSSFGRIDESNSYYDSVSSVIGKTMTYSRRHYKIQSSKLNESVKRSQDKDITFTDREKVGASMIFVEMYNRFLNEANEEIAIYDAIINGEIDILDEGFLNKAFDWGKKKVEDTKSKLYKMVKKTQQKASDFVSNAKEVATSGIEKVKATKDEIVDAAKKLKTELTDKVKAFYKFLVDLVKDSVNSVKDFINKLIDAFSSIGDNFVEVAKKLGVFDLDKGEQKLSVSYPKGTELKFGSEEEENMYNHIYETTIFILEKDKDSARKLMEEGFVDGIKSLMNNKWIVWAKSMVSSVKTSTWKTIFYSLLSSVIVNLLPKLLGLFLGAGCPIIPFVMALISLGINLVGFFKLIKQRNAQRKPGEAFFNKKTTFFFGLSLLSMALSVNAIIQTFGPALGELCRMLGIVDSTDGFSGLIAGWARSLDPRTALRGESYQYDTGKTKTVTDTTVKGTQVDMDVATKFGRHDASQVLKARAMTGNELGIGVDDKILPNIGKYGSYGFIDGIVDEGNYKKELIKNLIKIGETPAHAKELANHVFLKQITDITQHAEKIMAWARGALVPLTSKMPFVTTFIPFLNKDKWGEFKMRFASATRGYPAYVFAKSDMVDRKEAEKLGGGTAVDNLLKMHDESFNTAKNIIKKENNDEDVKVKDPEFIVVYVNTGKDTKKEEDKSKAKDKKDTSGEVVPGIIIDPLTLMCADVCEFNKRRRKQPYFLKGVFSKLSFRPIKDNDNDTKEYIRTKLFGDTLSTSLRQCVMYGAGRKYIEIVGEDNDDDKKKNEKLVARVREKEFGTENKIDADKNNIDLGELSPNEAVKCLNAFFEKNSTKECYDYLDGKYATKFSVKTNKKGNLVKRVLKDESSIENVRYYRLSKEEVKKIEDAYQDRLKEYEEYKKLSKKEKSEKKLEYKKKLEEYKANKNKLDPETKKHYKRPINPTVRPSKPKFEEDADGNKYKKATKAIIAKTDKKDLIDYVDLKIVPLLKDKDSEVYKKLNDDKIIKKILYKDGELNMDAIMVLKPFLFRPEKTFSENDEYELKKRLNGEGIEGQRLSKNKHLRKFLNLFKDEEQEHDTFKKIVEIIWDELGGEKRGKFGYLVDNHTTDGKVNDSFEYDGEYGYIFESYELEEDDYYDDSCEEEYDEIILEMREQEEIKRKKYPVIPCFEDFIKGL